MVQMKAKLKRVCVGGGGAGEALTQHERKITNIKLFTIFFHDKYSLASHY